MSSSIRMSHQFFPTAGYILTILQSGKLPDTNFRQYYQQPFFYLCGSAVSWLVSQVTGCQENYWLVDAAKLVSCYASGMVLLLGVKILKKVEVSRRAMLSVTAFLAFCPAFYLSYAGINWVKYFTYSVFPTPGNPPTTTVQ